MEPVDFDDWLDLGSREDNLVNTYRIVTIFYTEPSTCTAISSWFSLQPFELCIVVSITQTGKPRLRKIGNTNSHRASECRYANPNLSDFSKDSALNSLCLLPNSSRVTSLVSQVIDGSVGLLRLWTSRVGRWWILFWTFQLEMPLGHPCMDV